MERDADIMELWDSPVFASKEMAAQIRQDLRSRSLEYAYHPMCGWRPYPNRKLPTIEINSHSLRSKELSAFNDYESTGFILGSSFAWGHGASANENIPAYLFEELIRSRSGRKIGFINLADRAYTGIEQIKSLLFTADEIKPDFVICIAGHNDIKAGYEDRYKRQAMDSRVVEFFDWGWRIKLHRQESYLQRLLTVLQKGRLKKRQFPESFYSFTSPAREEIPLKICLHKIDVLNMFCKEKNIKIMHILQPCLYLKKKPSASEQKFLKLEDPERIRFFIEQYAIFRKKIWDSADYAEQHPKVFFFDSNSIIEGLEEDLFFDESHFSDGGYRLWSEKVIGHLENLAFFDKALAD